MNISKYCDFYLVEKMSKKNNQPYYAIVLRVNNVDYVLQFLKKSSYDLLLSSLSK